MLEHFKFYKNVIQILVSKYESLEGTVQKKVQGVLLRRRNVYIIVMNPKFPAAGSVLSLGVA
jgi:hypothetical protein